MQARGENDGMDAFEQFSRDIGQRLDLVQGAGGNTSAKSGGRMRIKASGAWLAEAGGKQIFVEVDLAALVAALSSDFDDATLKAALAAEGELRPSIETPLHALAPFAVVAHVHSANALAWAIRADANDRLAEKLLGIDWAFIPYVRPGAPLAKAVRKIYQTSRPSVLILGNHGLVVAADSIQALRALLDEIEERLSVDVAAGNFDGDIKKPPPPPGYRWVDDSPANFLAHDAPRRGVAAKGSLYPDHVVFLGPALTIAADCEAVAQMIPPPKVAIVKGAGVIARGDLTPGAIAMLDCLGLVMARLDPAAPVRYLSADDEAALLGWDAETYRQALDQRQVRR